MQWDRKPGYYSISLPNCYQDVLSPASSDDYRAEENDDEECSDDTCCESTGKKIM